MKLIGVIYKNMELDDEATFSQLPDDLKIFLRQVNGIVALRGGLHIRGCCVEPRWHSIDEVWVGKHAFWKYYPDILDIDIPFAQDCMGDQFLLRSGKVIKLNAETGDIDYLNITFTEFLNEVDQNPIDFLSMQPLIQFELEGKSLEAGSILNAFPPFYLNSSETTLQEAPILERLASLAQISRQFRNSKEDDEDGFQFIVG